MAIKLIILLIFFAVMIWVGFYCRRHARNVDGFVLGGRTVGPWLSAFAYGTSYFSAVVFVGYAGQFGWRFGISATWIGIGNALIGSLLAWMILGRRTRTMTQHLKTATMPEFFEKRYDSKKLKITASAIVFIFLIPYTASLYNGLSRLFAMAFNIDYTVCVIVMAVLTGIYVILGGYMATVINDFIQGIIMIGGIIAVIAAVLHQNGGLLTALDGLAAVEDTAAGTQAGSFASLFGPDPVGLISVVILTSLGTWGLPQMVQKFYSIRDDKAVKTGTVVSTAFALLVSGGCYFLGGFGRLYSDSVNVAANGYDSIIPAMVEHLPEILIGVVVVLVLSASMSTLASLVMASSSTLTLDFLKGTIIKKMDERRQLLIIRILIVVFIAISVVIAIIQYKSSVTFIAQMMGISWGALAGAFLAPFLYGLYWKGATRAGVWFCFGFSVVFMIANIVVKDLFPAILQSAINAGAFVMLVTLVALPVISAITKKPDWGTVDNAFRCYEKKDLE